MAIPEPVRLQRRGGAPAAGGHAFRNGTRARTASCGICLLVALSPYAAFAQPHSESGHTALDEVIVEARKRSEPLRDLPLAVDVLDRETLERAGVADLYDVAARTPGLYFESMWGGFGSAPVLRGQAQPTFGGDNVGVFVDGVYQANRPGIDVEPLDLERIEVVRGPQSALFGHSSFAGAIHFVPRRPSQAFEAGANVELGSAAFRAAQGHVSGPLIGDRLLARAAFVVRSGGGTWENAAQPGDRLGALRRIAATLSLAAPPDAAWQFGLTARLQSDRATSPAVSTLDYPDYNCGARDASSGAWSYFCGAVPVASVFEASPGLPDSAGESRQLRLRLARVTGTFDLESETSVYRATSRIVRDFDGSAAGSIFGVCDERLGCAAPGAPPRPVVRVVQVDSAFVQAPDVEELSQEFRLRGRAAGRLDWMLGATAFRTRDTARTALGFERGNLLASERLTAWLPAAPASAGPVSNANRALVADPGRDVVDFLRVESERRTFAVFGAIEAMLGERLRLRAEGRASRERLAVDSLVANFAPGFGRAIGPLEFHDVTPRLSADLRVDREWLVYVSAAKGSRSGGVNAVPGLIVEEQRFAPEYNLTWELGTRYAGVDERLRVAATAFYIDWQDTQITGLASSRGVGSLITRNTAGLATRGVELTLEASVRASLRLQAAVSWVDPRYRAGSEDPGSNAFCGLSSTSAESSFCTIGPTRFPGAAGAILVPWIDGNVPQRAPRLQWQVSLSYAPAIEIGGWRPFANVGVNAQSDVYDRSIDGARFGERTLLDSRFGLRRDSWSVEIWGRNLGDERYVRAAATRLPQFYPTTPRPLDLVQGERRRVGITVRYTADAR